MKRSAPFFALLCVLVVAFPGSAGAAEGKERNAAVFYQQAIDLLGKMGLSISQKIDSIEAFKALPSNIQKVLAGPELRDLDGILEFGLHCPESCFLPHRKGDLSDPRLPLRKFSTLKQVALARAWGLAHDRQFAKALKLFLGVYQFGQHLAQEKTFPSAMVGLGIRKDALQSIRNLFNSWKTETGKSKTLQFLSRLPKPYFATKPLLNSAFQIFKNSLARKAITPQELVDSGIIQEEQDPDDRRMEELCRSNRYVFKSAVEMFYADHSKRKRDTNLAELLSHLMKGGYLQVVPTCLAHGKYSLKIGSDNLPELLCSVHNSAAPEHSTPRQKALEKAKTYLESPAFRNHARLIQDLMEAGLKLDPRSPTFSQDLLDIEDRERWPEAPMVELCVPNYRRLFREQAVFQNEVEELIRFLQNMKTEDAEEMTPAVSVPEEESRPPAPIASNEQKSEKLIPVVSLKTGRVVRSITRNQHQEIQKHPVPKPPSILPVSFEVLKIREETGEWVARIRHDGQESEIRKGDFFGPPVTSNGKTSKRLKCVKITLEEVVAYDLMQRKVVKGHLEE